jgi:hypothetical protein
MPLFWHSGSAAKEAERIGYDLSFATSSSESLERLIYVGSRRPVPENHHILNLSLKFLEHWSDDMSSATSIAGTTISAATQSGQFVSTTKGTYN